MKSKQVLPFLVVLAAVVLAGCTTTKPGTGGNPFCGGIDGIEMKFVEGGPPAEVFDNNQFPFEVTLRLLNKGEFTVQPSDTKIELSGISQSDFGGPSYSKIVAEAVPSRQKDQDGKCTEGSPIHVSFGVSPDEPFKYKHSLPGNTPFTLRADICYRYKTSATTQFCVDKLLPRFDREPTCKIDEAKTVSNSGSPVQVANFKQDPGGENKLTFSFDVVHKGTGAVHAGALCDTAFQNKNKVHVKVSASVGAITCSTLGGTNEGDVVLTENKRPVTCSMNTASVSGQREFQTPISIELSYNYKQHEDTAILVKHLR